MKLSARPELDAALQKGLAPVYLIFGDEPLQAAEAGDAVRQSARAAGFDGWELHFVAPGFAWGALSESADTMSLFGDRRLLDVRFSDKPDRDAASWLSSYAAKPPPDCILLLNCAALPAEDQKKAWFRAVERVGVVLHVRTLEGPALIKWLDRRMNEKGLLADQSGLRLLAARVEGNLLAAAQEIEKLAVLFGQGRIEDGQIASAVADSARYDIFDLVDAALNDRLSRAHRVIEGLKSEGIATPVILWALAREARTLARLAFAVEKGERLESALMRQNVWESRRKAVASALSRIDIYGAHECLLRCARADRIIKGQEQGSPWDALLEVCAGMSGHFGTNFRTAPYTGSAP